MRIHEQTSMRCEIPGLGLRSAALINSFTAGTRRERAQNARQWGVLGCRHAVAQKGELLDVGLHLVQVLRHRLAADAQRVAVASLMDVEHRLDRAPRSPARQCPVDCLRPAQSERWHLGDLFGQRLVSPSSWSRGTTLFTIPVLCTSSAVIARPVRRISFALRRPSSQVWPWYSTPPMPMSTTGSENCASSAAMIRSHGQHNGSPPEMHRPWTAAMDGFGTLRQRRVYSGTVWPRAG